MLTKAVFIADGAKVVIEARHSGKVWSVSGGSTADNAAVVQWWWKNNEEQAFRFVLADTYYRITPVIHKGAVAVGNASAISGAQVMQWTWNDGDEQKWRKVDLGDGYSRFEAMHSGKALAIASASHGNGASAIQWDRTSGTEQQFKLHHIDGYVKIEARHSGKFLTVKDGSAGDGDWIVQRDAADIRAQLFYLQACDWWYFLQPLHSNKNLAIGNASKLNAAALIQYAATGGDEQKFRVVSYHDTGWHNLQVRHSRKFLAVRERRMDDGADIIQWDWAEGATEQQYRLPHLTGAKLSLWGHPTRFPPGGSTTIPAEHTYVTSDDKQYFGCPWAPPAGELFKQRPDGTWEHDPKKVDNDAWHISTGYGDSAKAAKMAAWKAAVNFVVKGLSFDDIFTNYAGCIYALNGVCHQMANRVALPSRMNVGSLEPDPIRKVQEALRKKTPSSLGSYVLYGPYGTYAGPYLAWADVTTKMVLEKQPSWTYLEVFNSIVEQANAFVPTVAGAFETQCKTLGLAVPNPSLLAAASARDLLFEALADEAALDSATTARMKEIAAETLARVEREAAANAGALSRQASVAAATVAFADTIDGMIEELYRSLAAGLGERTFQRVFGFPSTARPGIIEPGILLAALA